MPVFDRRIRKIMSDECNMCEERRKRTPLPKARRRPAAETAVCFGSLEMSNIFQAACENCGTIYRYRKDDRS